MWPGRTHQYNVSGGEGELDRTIDPHHRDLNTSGVSQYDVDKDRWHAAVKWLMVWGILDLVALVRACVRARTAACFV